MEQTSLRGARWLKTLEQHKVCYVPSFELRYHKSQPQLEFTNEAKRLQSIDGKVVNNRSALGQLQVSLFVKPIDRF